MVTSLINNIAKQIELVRERLQKIAHESITFETITQEHAKLKGLRDAISQEISTVYKNKKNLTWSIVEKKRFFEEVTVTMEHLDKAINTLEAFSRYLELYNEQDAIQRGLYQKHLYCFTYLMNPSLTGPSFKEDRILREYPEVKWIADGSDGGFYKTYPVMDELGFRCTASLQSASSEVFFVSGLVPIEIQINFYGTVDFASKLADMESGGPGQETIKKYESQLIEKVNSLIYQASVNNPGKDIRLRIAGHSLGGALAKGFVHTLQRAIAVQQNEPEKIIDTIRKKLPATQTEYQPHLKELEEQLTKDKEQFKGRNALNKVTGVTLYALGAPGVSVKTDEEGTLMTYYHEPHFLRAYNHFHSEDIIPKFGEREFLSGTNLAPRILTHKAIQFTTEITDEEVKDTKPLPFPGITKRIMAAHNKQIYGIDGAKVTTQIVHTNQSTTLSEKFSFSYSQRKLYEVIFCLAKFLASFKFMVMLIPSLASWSRHEVAKPDLIPESKKEDAARVILNTYKQYKEESNKREDENESDSHLRPS